MIKWLGKFFTISSPSRDAAQFARGLTADFWHGFTVGMTKRSTPDE